VNPALAETLANFRAELLARRDRRGHWRGFLATSALATATAVVALWMHDPRRHRDAIRKGLAWLAANANRDGGWGDTTISKSNINTTALCYAALAAAPHVDAEYRAAEEGAEAWLRDACGGSIGRDRLIDTILAFYGRDRTFSTPILTLLTLSGRLGDRREAFARVPQLPFELAAFPRSWFRFLDLQVVSYALPALIAIGQNRHHHRPTRNPVMRMLRDLTRKRTLRLMDCIQPPNGGFLEAIPLTCFVVANMCAMGRGDHPVVRRGVSFVYDLLREDGGWPIDTDLATWVTTSSVRALALRADPADEIDVDHVRDWLLGQQFHEVHPFTATPPGGWSWTDLPGAVPDADDTPGTLLALDLIGGDDPRVPGAVAGGVDWLLGLQNRDGGIPTFCRGWGKLPFDQSAADISSHTLLAWQTWRGRVDPGLGHRVDVAIPRLIRYLERSQREDGSWIPLWFGNEHQDDDVNPTYGTARCLIPLARCRLERPAMLARALCWLLDAQQGDGGWSGGPWGEPSLEETGLAVDALCSMHPRISDLGDPAITRDRVVGAIRRGVDWIVEASDRGRRFPPHPIGFYFAKLWYFEDNYPVIWPCAALSKAVGLLSGEDSEFAGSSL